MGFYWTYYLMGIVLLPAIAIAAWAQGKVSLTYGKYSKIPAKSGITAGQLIKHLLETSGLASQITLIRVGGELNDYFDPKKKQIALSGAIYDSSSIAALGVACHEFGHAIQWSKNYFPMKARQVLIPITNFSSVLLWPLVVVGLIIGFGSMGNVFVGNILLWIGIGIFGLAVLVNLVTLPVEYNASRRATTLLEKTGVLDSEEIVGAKKVLSAAALTYVAALIVSILNVVRFVLTVLLSSRRNSK